MLGRVVLREWTVDLEATVPIYTNLSVPIYMTPRHRILDSVRPHG